MTIIQPGKNKKGLALGIVLFTVLLGVLIGGDVFMYNATVDLNYNINLAGEKINKMEVTNAELKNKMYDLLNSRALENLAAANGLTKDKGPQYFQVSLNP
ncbi:MAG: hypothetical protein Q8P97_01345 [bacterium]|nr:hypothetical protein [bacterium]